MNKGIKYALLLALIVFVGYNSVYFKKLSEVRNAEKAATFDAASYAAGFLHTTLPANQKSATDLSLLSRTLAGDPAQAFALSHAQNDGNIRFFLVKGIGTITKIDSENVCVSVEGVPQKVLLETKYIIGNAARDGSGLISVDDFTTMMEMNTVSEELNKLIRTEVVPPFIAAARPGARVSFLGGIEWQKDKPVPDSLEITPMILTIQ